MAASSFSSLLLLFFLSQLLSTAFTSMHGFIDDPVIQQVVSPDSHDDLLASAEHQFLAFKREYGKTYPTEEEDDYRFGVFMCNLRQARRNQIDDPTAVYGVTKFSDLTPSEFRRKYSGSSPQIERKFTHDDCNKAPILSTDGLPERWNWKENHTVTPVKNQNECNGCWAFSTIAVIEGAHYLANKELLELSEQQLIACSAETCLEKPDGICNNGCCGGYRVLAFKYVNNSGVVGREDYPFGSAWDNDKCEVKNKIVASIHNYSCIDKEEQYKPHLVKHGPIAVNINIDLLRCYKGGVLCSPKKFLGNEIAQHAVTLVGYDSCTEAGEPFKYWIVKNSFGEDWGEHGYFRVCEGILTASDKGIYAIAVNQTGFHQIN